MPISSQARPPPVVAAKGDGDRDLFVALSKRLADHAILVGQESNPKYRSPTKKLAVQQFKETAQKMVLRAIQTVVNLRRRSARRRCLDTWMQFIDRKNILWQAGPGSKCLGAMVGKKILFAQRVFQAWKGIVAYSFLLWVKLAKAGAHVKRKVYTTCFLAWWRLAAGEKSLHCLRHVITSRSVYWSRVKVLHAWQNRVAIKVDVVRRSEHACHMAQLHCFAAWRTALAGIYSKRIRILKGSVILKVVDTRSASRAFSLWRGVREEYRQQVWIGGLIWVIVNKAVRLMVAAHFHEWKLLVHSSIRLRLQIHKQTTSMHKKLLSHCFVDWVHRSMSQGTHDVRQETHNLLVKMRVLQSLFRLTKIIRRLRMRAIYWKKLLYWNRWTDYVRENQRLRVQMPYSAGTVVPNHGEMRQYRYSKTMYPLSSGPLSACAAISKKWRLALLYSRRAAAVLEIRARSGRAATCYLGCLFAMESSVDSLLHLVENYQPARPSCVLGHTSRGRSRRKGAAPHSQP